MVAGVAGHFARLTGRVELWDLMLVAFFFSIFMFILAPARAKKERLAHLATFRDLTQHYSKIRRFTKDFDEKRSVKAARRQKRHGYGKRKEKWRRGKGA